MEIFEVLCIIRGRNSSPLQGQHQWSCPDSLIQSLQSMHFLPLFCLSLSMLRIRLLLIIHASQSELRCYFFFRTVLVSVSIRIVFIVPCMHNDIPHYPKYTSIWTFGNKSSDRIDPFYITIGLKDHVQIAKICI